MDGMVSFFQDKIYSEKVLTKKSKYANITKLVYSGNTNDYWEG